MSNIQIVSPKPEEKPPSDEAKSVASKWLEESKWPLVDGKRVKPVAAEPMRRKRRR